MPGVTPDEVTAILVTRGDVDLTPIIESYPYERTIIWDNSERPYDAKVFGRYLAIQEAETPLIYFQDDDCIMRRHEELMAGYEDGKIACNFGGFLSGPPGWDGIAAAEEQQDHALLGWGALFHRDLPWEAFRRYWRHYPMDDIFKKVPDWIFTTLTPAVQLWLDSEWLPCVDNPNRTHKEPDHGYWWGMARTRGHRILGRI